MRQVAVVTGLVTLTPAQLRVLRNMGHRYMQGFSFARPLELEQLGAQLRALDGIRAGRIDDSIVAMVGSPVRTLS
jgi:predicted signal transduction protein with EAL and GGDEF domain